MKKKKDSIGMKKNSMEIKKDSMKIMKALSGVDEELLKRSESENGNRGRKKPANRLWISLGSCAAAVCFAVAGVAGFRGIQLSEETQPYGELFSPDPVSVGLASLGGDEGKVGGEALGGVKSEGWQEMKQEMKQETEPEANPAAQNGQETDAVLQRERERQALPEKLPEEVEKAALESLAPADSAKVSDTYTYDMEVCSVPLAVSEKLTEEQARQVETLGAYVPAAPKGYVFLEANLYQKGEEESSLSISWRKGMDSIMMSVSIVDEEETAVVDVSRPECYDQRLYEIPYFYSVPEEYRETVDHPVFAAEDLSLDIVKSRVLNRGIDLGDTDTPRGDFYVLYPDGVMIRFNGKATPEQVWEMLSPLSGSAAPTP